MNRSCLVILMLLSALPILLPRKTYAQQNVVNIVYDTICGSDTLEGYYASGIFKDTFQMAGYDSVRVLHLKVLPTDGFQPSASFFNTGSDGLGGSIGGGSQDMHWLVSSAGIAGPYLPAIVMTAPPPNYSSSPWPNCKWIAHSASGNHSADLDFYYKIEFDLPCFNFCRESHNEDSIFCLKLDFMADNSINEIYVNGVAQSPGLGNIIPVTNPYTYVGFQTPSAVSPFLCSSWKKGVNSLIVKVSSSPGQSAFLAQASINAVPPAPLSDFDLSVANGIRFNDTGCAPYMVQFENRSLYANTYMWDFGDGSAPSDEPHPAHIFNYAGTYTVTLVAYNSYDCTRRDSSTLDIVVQDFVSYTVADIFCANEPYLFNGIKIYSPGVYTARFPRAQNCDSLVTLSLSVLPLPEIQIAASNGEHDFCLGDTVILSGNGATAYLWLNTHDNIVGIGNTIGASLSSLANTIQLVGEGTNKCRDTTAITIRAKSCCLMFLPNAFSPNGDGNNDCFAPVTNGHFSKYQLFIFNRWGQRVFNSSAINNCWDGTYNGRPAELGTYHYYLESKCMEGPEINRRGDVVLVR